MEHKLSAEHVPERQFIADRIKHLIEQQPARLPSHKAAKRRALEAVAEFERCDWRPVAFEMAVEQVAPGKMWFDQRGEPVLGGQVWEMATKILDRYVDIMTPDRAMRELPRLFDTEEAAEYLGLSVSAVKYHVHTEKNLTPAKMIGHSLVFTQAQLDEFKRTKRQPGRPAGKRDETTP